MRKILEDMMAMVVVASEEKEATFTDKELWLFYGVLGSLAVFLIVMAINI